jgi:hypothetical protein
MWGHGTLARAEGATTQTLGSMRGRKIGWTLAALGGNGDPAVHHGILTKSGHPPPLFGPCGSAPPAFGAHSDINGDSAQSQSASVETSTAGEYRLLPRRLVAEISRKNAVVMLACSLAFIGVQDQEWGLNGIG